MRAKYVLGFLHWAYLGFLAWLASRNPDGAHRMLLFGLYWVAALVPVLWLRHQAGEHQCWWCGATSHAASSSKPAGNP